MLRDVVVDDDDNDDAASEGILCKFDGCAVMDKRARRLYMRLCSKNYIFKYNFKKSLRDKFDKPKIAFRKEKRKTLNEKRKF